VGHILAPATRAEFINALLTQDTSGSFRPAGVIPQKLTTEDTENIEAKRNLPIPLLEN
jgi:hypothetical protein